MSTAISTNVQTIDWPALSATSRQAAILKANLDGEAMTERDLVRVKTPLGGSTTFTLDNNGNLETAEEIVGLLVGIGKRGYLWPSEDPTEQRPVIVSNDLLVGYRVSDDLGASIDPKVLDRYRIADRTYDWAAMSTSAEFGFGSGRNGAKRIKEMRILAILRQGEMWPLLVTVGGGSLQPWESFKKKLPSFHYECVVGVKAVKVKNKAGQPYSQLSFRTVGVISEEAGEMASRIYTQSLGKMFSAPPAGAVTAESNDAGDDE
jgi:hypothetical protein